jgi:hypothetical protein
LELALAQQELALAQQRVPQVKAQLEKDLGWDLQGVPRSAKALE